MADLGITIAGMKVKFPQLSDRGPLYDKDVELWRALKKQAKVAPRGNIRSEESLQRQRDLNSSFASAPKSLAKDFDNVFRGRPRPSNLPKSHLINLPPRGGDTVTVQQVTSSNSALRTGARDMTAEDVALFAYGGTEYAWAVRENNPNAFFPTGGPRVQKFFCPSVLDRVRGGTSSDISADGWKDFYSLPDWADTERAAGESYTDEIVVLIFQRNSSTHTKLGGTVSLHYRASLFEASRALEITWPFELNDDPLINLYGNHVVCAFRGRVFFMGVLVAPSVNTEGGVTMTWVAQSHTYVPLTTHFNPSTVNTSWKEMPAIEVLYEISNTSFIPMRVATNNLRTADEKEKFFGPKMLGYINSDEDGLKAHDMQDVLGTTPIKFIQDILEPTGIFATADDDGFLLIHKVHIDNPSVREFIDGEPGFELSVQYDFKDLAKTYCVLSQRRDSEAAEAVRHDSFPLPIYRNAVRSNTLLETGELSRRELSKSLAKAVDIKITVPGWVNERTGQLWRLEDIVYVFSARYGLMERLAKPAEAGQGYYELPLALIISGIKATWSEKGQTTELMLSLPGVFDTEFYRTIPFLTAPNEAFIVENVELKVPIIETVEEARQAAYEDD